MASRPESSSLAAELRLNAPFRDPAHEAVVGILRTASLVDRAISSALRPWRLSTSQFNLLRILRGAGPDGMATLAIRDRMIDPAAAVTRLVGKLVDAGLVERDRIGSDRRQVICRITDHGRALLSELDQIVAVAESRVGDNLSESELREFNRVLTVMRSSLK